jgi:hypothetical protein
LRIYPEARFLCLYRHPMDVIASGVEACPWGLGGYGFDPWRIDLGAGTVVFAGRDAQESSDWDVIGSAAAWEQVMAGSLNLSAALRACQLRYCDSGDAGGPFAADIRLSILADLLGVVTW